MRRIALGFLLASAVLATPAVARRVTVEEVPLEQVQALMTAGKATSVEVTRAYLDRIAALDRKGPALRSVIAINPDALAQAKALDAERKAGVSGAAAWRAGADQGQCRNRRSDGDDRG